MPTKDRHGKTAQDYRSALIAELDAVPDYRRRKPRRSPLLTFWLLVRLALSGISLLWIKRWVHSNPAIAAKQHQNLVTPISLNMLPKKDKIAFEKRLCRRYFTATLKIRTTLEPNNLNIIKKMPKPYKAPINPNSQA